MNTHGHENPPEGTQPHVEGNACVPKNGSQEVSGLFRQVPVLRWVLFLCGVLGMSLAACLLMHPRSAVNAGTLSSNRCVCR